MLKITPQTLERVAREYGWMHQSGRLDGTLNATKMARGLGVAVSSVTRAYDTGVIGETLLTRIALKTGWSLDSIVTVVETADAA
ncbi:hypothetical protein [Microbacterium rhizophilus]|uniref:hypothetical protein n=1 Tax=Microbacterium rhizophilus TaxID=3138934 RepID=UPI0031E559F7